MLFARIGEHLNFALLDENPLTFVYCKKDENGLRFSGKEYNHYQSLSAKLRKMGIESYIAEFRKMTKAEYLNELQKQEERTIKKMIDLNYTPEEIEQRKQETVKYLWEVEERMQNWES